MPISNEASFNNQSLGLVLAQDYPHNLIEVIVVDSMSDDRTREIVQCIIDEQREIIRNNPSSVARRLSSITLLDNPVCIMYPKNWTVS